MLDDIIKNTAPEIISSIKEKFGLSPAQASKAVDTTKESLEQSVTQEATSGNIDGLLAVFNSGGDATGNNTFQNLANNLSGDYVRKLGIPEGLAKQISSFILPLIISKITSFSGGKLDKGDLTKMLGSDILKGKLGDTLKGGLGNMFK